MIATRRTTLIEATPAFLRAIIAGDFRGAGALLDLEVGDDWPGSSEAEAGLPLHLESLETYPAEQPWRIRLILVGRRVVGSINLKGPPNVRGDVEIGWGLVASARGRGLATEASLAVIDWAFESAAVRRVIATIAPDHERSQHVALRLGMQPLAELHRGLPIWELTRERRAS
jgi:[ribosomal protein S5]-alanine N-acetyltransferase